jgi:CHASE2 domain-containing sensor protein
MKLVILKFDGDLDNRGFRVTLEIGLENARADIEVSGSLPPYPDLVLTLHQWRLNYRNLGISSRIKPQEIIYDGLIQNHFSQCSEVANELSQCLQVWLDSEGFRCINNTLREELKRDEIIRVLIKSENSDIQRLPWHLWDFFNRYSQAEFAVASIISETTPKPPGKTKVRILAILGNSVNINIQADRDLLESLPNVDSIFLIEPSRQQLNNYLWQQWDILFFAGHSETDNDTGRIYINQTDSLTIDELKYGLKQAISQGLQIAIFNSCDGLGLARQLTSLHIPQMIVMREPVPDEVAQEYLKHFLKAFASGKSFYLASREAREKLQGMEDRFPNATWLPVIFQNPIVVPLNWDNLSIRKQSPRFDYGYILLVTLLVTVAIMGTRYFGLLQPMELKAYDHFMISRPKNESPDPRILIVTIDEKDIDYQIDKKMKMVGSLADEALLILLQQLNKYQASTVGLDVYHAFAVDSQYPQLTDILAKDSDVFAICKHPESSEKLGTQLETQIPPPREVKGDRHGFSDLIDDDDNIVRRQLINMDLPYKSQCEATESFNFKLALHYLQKKGIKEPIISYQGDLEIDNKVFKRLKKHTSGYQKIDDSGYQILLNHRSLNSLENIAKKVSLKDVLNDKVPPEDINENIVIVGVTAQTDKYSSQDEWKIAGSGNQKIPGVFLQAHMVSQIISAVEDNRKLFWWWPTWLETIWVLGWSLLGVIIPIFIRKPLYLGITILLSTIVIFQSCLAIFIQSGWIPFIPAILALILASTLIIFRARIN